MKNYTKNRHTIHFSAEQKRFADAAIRKKDKIRLRKFSRNMTLNKHRQWCIQWTRDYARYIHLMCTLQHCNQYKYFFIIVAHHLIIV